MQASGSFKQAFLKNMLLGLRLGGVSSKSMSLLERKRAIKLSADIAMAFARGEANWSRALIANICNKEDNTNAIARSILGKDFERLTKTKPGIRCTNIPISKKILRKSFRASSKIKKGAQAPRGIAASILARSLVRKKTKVLKCLVPGGELLSDASLLPEALDYVTTLRAQVDVLQHLTKVFDASNLKSHSPSPQCKTQKPNVLKNI